MNVLILGGSGLFGRKTAAHLLADPEVARVVSLDLAPPPEWFLRGVSAHRDRFHHVRGDVSQIEDILLIEREMGLGKLPRSLREIARVREEHPDSPLSALGEFLDPPLGKSGVNSRLRRLRSIAEKLRS